MLQERVKHQPGRRGGAAAYIRALVYAHLGFSSGEWPPMKGNEAPDQRADREEP